MDPRVAEAMDPFQCEIFGNPSSLHWAGRMARAAVDKAREQVARLLGAQPSQIVFTASGTEADNMALIGVADACGWRDCHILTSRIEHPAILETCAYLESRGIEVTHLGAEANGIVRPDEFAAALRPNTRLVSVMTANNVTGALQPIQEIGRIARDRGALFHTDAVQAVGKISFDMKTAPIDLLSLSAHKLHGPKGVGVLFIRSDDTIRPLIHGGGQEGGRRSATENTAGIVGLGEAAEIAASEMTDEAARLVRMRDRLIDGILSSIPNAYLIGDRFRRLPSHACFGFEGAENDAIRLLLALDKAGIAASTGSACSARHAGEPSTVLQAMGMNPIQARGSLRISLGRFNTMSEVERFLDVIPRLAAGMRPSVSRLAVRQQQKGITSIGLHQKNDM